MHGNIVRSRDVILLSTRTTRRAGHSQKFGVAAAFSICASSRWAVAVWDANSTSTCVVERSAPARPELNLDVKSIMGRQAIDSATEEALKRFLRVIAGQYDMAGAFLYGSRARGGHRRDSDADVAVLLRGARQRLLTTTLAMSDVAYDCRYSRKRASTSRRCRSGQTSGITQRPTRTRLCCAPSQRRGSDCEGEQPYGAEWSSNDLRRRE